MGAWGVWFVIILAGSLVATGLLALLRHRLGVPERPSREHIQPSAFSFFTTLFAFFLGFAIVTLWSNYLGAKSNVTREANSLLMAYRISEALPRTEAFRQSLKAYVKTVVEEEWPRMAQDSMSERAGQLLEEVGDRFSQLRLEDKRDNQIFVAVAGHLSEARLHRLGRALALDSNLYQPIWGIIILGLLAAFYGLYFIHLPQNPVQIIFEFMLIFIVIACVFFIIDLDTPFSGHIKIKPTAFQEVYARMLALP